MASGRWLDVAVAHPERDVPRRAGPLSLNGAAFPVQARVDTRVCDADCGLEVAAEPAALLRGV